MSAPAEVRHVERRKTCLVYSPGGHKAELDRALLGTAFTDCYRVTFASGRDDAPSASGRDQDGRGDAETGERTYRLCHPRRSVARTLLNAWQAWRVLRREKPELIVSTGADLAAATLILGKLSGATVVFVETGGTLEPSLTGKLVYPFADLFVVQWPEKLRRFPRAVLADGPLL